MGHLFGLIIVGFVVGLVARILMPGSGARGCLMTMAFGLLGSVVGSYLGEFFGFYRQGENAGFIMSVIGAAIVLAVYRALAGRREW